MPPRGLAAKRPFLKRGRFRHWAVACKNSSDNKQKGAITGISLCKGQQAEIIDLRHHPHASYGLCPTLGWILLWQSGLRCCHIIAVPEATFPELILRKAACAHFCEISCGAGSLLELGGPASWLAT